MTSDTMSYSQVYCGTYHTMVVTSDRSVMGFGFGGDGQLGLGSQFSGRIVHVFWMRLLADR